MTTGNFFECCKRCRECCRSSERFVHIYVCGHEEQLIGRLASRGRDTKEIMIPYAASCPFLSDEGCTLGAIKPFMCRLYPLLLLKDGSLGVDPACTLSGEYIGQLHDPASDARRHFEAMKAEAALLSDKEKAMLAEWSRHVCDTVTLDSNNFNYS